MERPVQTTVVLTAWDRYAGVGLIEAVDSVRDQAAPAHIVVVDNASEVPLPDLGPVETVRSEQRVTLGEARNLGLQRADTPYVLFWDADDAMLPGTLAFLEDSIGSDSRLAAYAAAIVESPSGARHRWPRRWVACLLRWPRLFAFLHCIWSMYPTTGATIMRTDLVRHAGGYAPTHSGHDWVLGVSLAFRGRFGWSERPGRTYRIHSHSVLARHAGPRHLLAKAGEVRDRLRSDPGVPGWVRSALPLIAAGQHVAIGLHVARVSARRPWRFRQAGSDG